MVSTGSRLNRPFDFNLGLCLLCPRSMRALNATLTEPGGHGWGHRAFFDQTGLPKTA